MIEKDFINLFNRYKIKFKVEDIKQLVKRFDRNFTGKVSLEEFMRELKPRSKVSGIWFK